LCLRLAEIACHELGIGFGQVHNDQPIQDICELRIDVEAQELPAQPKILPQQHRDSALAGIDVRHHGGQIVQVQPGVAFRIVPKRIAGCYQALEFGLQRVALQKRDDQAT
jgi:hypothetical protein